MENSPKKNKMLEALKSLEKKLNDPIQRDRILADMASKIDHMETEKENKFDNNKPWGTVGDFIAYGLNHSYPDETEEILYIGSYSRHGNGD